MVALKTDVIPFYWEIYIDIIIALTYKFLNEGVVH